MTSTHAEENKSILRTEVNEEDRLNGGGELRSVWTSGWIGMCGWVGKVDGWVRWMGGWVDEWVGWVDGWVGRMAWNTRDGNDYERKTKPLNWKAGSWVLITRSFHVICYPPGGSSSLTPDLPPHGHSISTYPSTDTNWVSLRLIL